MTYHRKGGPWRDRFVREGCERRTTCNYATNVDNNAQQMYGGDDLVIGHCRWRFRRRRLGS